MLTGRRHQKRGFTLVETVVTVGIVAALAAVVYPTVVKQFDTADPTRAAEDLGSIATAIEAFGVNVRPQQPKDIEDLTNVIRTTLASGDSTALGTAYSTTDSANWRGPYLAVSVPASVLAVDTVINTGFSGAIPNHLELFNSAGTNGGTVELTANSANADYLAVQVLGLSGAAFNAINLLIDGASEKNATQRRQSGRFRCPGASPTDGAACAAAFYLASPLRH